MKVVRVLGAVIWLCALSTGAWAHAKPVLVIAASAGVLGITGTLLLTWPGKK